MTHDRSRRSAGFTLIEVLLVLVILVILVSLVAPSFIGVQQKAKMDAARSQIGLFDAALKVYQLNVGFYPTTDVGLEALRDLPASLPNPQKWQGPYIEKPIPLDPWDNPYQYECPGRVNPNSYDIWSMGPDGQSGTEDDVGNWQQ